jgi:nucleoside-diphosphate-sugar epimerase
LLDVRKAHSLGWRHKIELFDGLSGTYRWFEESLTSGDVRGY